MTVKEDKVKKKEKILKKLRNPLQKYLGDAPYKYACHKAWRPAGYEFRPEILFYDANAYDKFIAAMEIRKPDEHYYFTRLLQSFDTNIAPIFYKWIRDATDRTRAGTHNLAYCDEVESPCAKAQWTRELRPEKTVWPLRRSYSASQINLNEAEFRAHRMTKITPKVEDCTRTYYPFFIKQRTFIKAQEYSWKCNGGYHRPNCKVGFVKVKFVEGTTYGPTKFFVYLTDPVSDRGIPGKFFTHHFNKKVNTANLQLDIPSDGYVGCAIYYDRNAPRGCEYIPVIVLDHVVTNRNVVSTDIFLYNMEIGTIIKCRYSEKNARLRVLPSQLLFYVRPIGIPCRMYEDQISLQSWNDFVNEVNRTGEMYVTGVFNRYLQVGRVKPTPIRNLERLFCDDLHCLGGCEKDEEDLSDFCFVDIYRKTRKKSLSSADISDVEL